MDRLVPGVEKRHGPSISQKMIFQACAVIVLIVFLFGGLSIISVGRVYDQTTRQQELLQRKSLKEVGAATLGTLAASSRTFFEQSNDNDLRAYVSQLARSSDLISAIYVLDPNQGLVAHSDSSKNPREGHPPVAEESWKTILDLWKARKDDPAKQDPSIASYEFTGTEGRQALFAMPVFPAGVPATVNASIDPEAPVKPYGYVVLGLTFSYLEHTLAVAKAQKEKDTRDTGLKTAFFGALSVLLGALLAIVQGLRIAKPIKMLAWRADQIAKGDLETRVEVTSTDEIGMLGENFNYMADQLVVLLKQTAEKATMEKELEVARTIQETLVPSNDTVDRQSIKLSGYFQPASQCGGDWWSYHDLEEGKVLVVIGDVTGHGVPSAMITAAAKAACDVARAVTNNTLGCSQLLEIMNHAIFESAKRKFVMTCFASVVDTKNRTITYANAGHNFPYLYRQQNGRGEFGSLMTRGNRLGDLPESTYGAKSMDLLPGDVLIWYTDGIIECENEQGEEYGEKRFRSSIRRAAHLEPAEMRDNVVNASMQFFGEKPRKDDITMVVARIY